MSPEEFQVKNERRVALIFKDALTPEEGAELAALTAETDAYLDVVAPRPRLSPELRAAVEKLLEES